MRRRELIALLGSAAALRPLTGAAQTKMPVIGMLSTLSDRAAWVVLAFKQGLRETGHIESQNVAIEYRWAGVCTSACLRSPPISFTATST